MIVRDPMLPPMPEPVFTPFSSPNSKENHESEKSLGSKVENAVVKPGRPLQESDRINCSLIITEEAARDLGGFLKGLADLLQVGHGAYKFPIRFPVFHVVSCSVCVDWLISRFADWFSIV